MIKLNVPCLYFQRISRMISLLFVKVETMFMNKTKTSQANIFLMFSIFLDKIISKSSFD